MGTRLCDYEKNNRFKDHPHAYGDKNIPRNQSFITIGSSPRVWGQVYSPTNPPYTHRIIPTRMGTRRVFPAKQTTRRDHPHAYGDKTKEIKENSGFAKSTA